MKKYKVFLTKSHKMAAILAHAFKPGENEVEQVCYGGCDETVPAVYKNQGYYMCCVIYSENARVEPYELIIG